MKALWISSIAIVLIIGGGLFFMNNEITETQPVEHVGYNDTKIFVDGSSTKFTEILPTTVQSTNTTEVATDNNIAYPTLEDLMLKYIPNRYDLTALFYRLKYKYPEKFAPENIESSFNYVLSKFDLTQIRISDDIIHQVEFNISW